MGRAALIFALLMTTLYAAILSTLSRNIGGVPTVLIRNQLMKETENTSDFALRNAIRNAGSVEFLDSYLQGENFADEITFTQNFNNFNIGNCSIDSLRYSYTNSHHHYKVMSFIRASLQGVSVSKNAEMAFNYPFLTLGSSKPNILYLEMERLILFPWLFEGNNYLPDSSGNNYTGTAEGFSLISATVPWGGAFSRYCTKFNGFNNYININPQPDSTGVDSLSTDNSFSVLLFAKVDKWASNQGTLLWIPSEPTHSTLRNKPSAGIWYNKSTNKMHFAVTQNDASNTMLELAVSHTLRAEIYSRWTDWLGSVLGPLTFNLRHWEYPWCSYGLTYNQGVLKGYINGVLVGTVIGDNVRAYPSLHGMTLGRRDLRGGSFSTSTFKYFRGVMDQAGMHDRALNGSEMHSWHNGVMSSTLIKYIRD
jgi:hypothetical protein